MRQRVYCIQGGLDVAYIYIESTYIYKNVEKNIYMKIQSNMRVLNTYLGDMFLATK